MPELTVYYRHAGTLTGKATAAVTAGQVVKVSATRSDGGNIPIAACGAGEPAFGVAAIDTAAGATLPVVREGVVGLTASAAITAGQRVETAATGKVAPHSTGVPIGVAVADIPATATGPVALNLT